MTQTNTLLSICITTALIVILGEGCAKDSMDNSYRPTSAHGAPCTPEARAASMRKALRETSEGQEIHQAYVENRLKMLQHERDASRNSMITDMERSKIESRIRTGEETNIEDFAKKNCHLKNSQSELHPIAKETSHIDTLLRLQGSLHKSGQVSKEEIQRARKKVQLKKEEYWLRQKLTDLLISANNYG